MIVAISDLHITSKEDSSYESLLAFLDHQKTCACEEIFFLGDIFDVMIGDHPEYLSTYFNFFNKIEILLSKGKTIHFVEGNHDFHLEKLFTRSLKSGPTLMKNFHYHTNGLEKKYHQKTFHFGHGDEILSNDKFYMLYRRIVRSWLFKILANHLLNYTSINIIADFFAASFGKNKKDYGIHNNKNEKKINHYRHLAAHHFKNKEVDYIILGHSHVEDYFKLETKHRPLYINLGLFIKERHFFYAEQNGDSYNVGFEKLETTLLQNQHTETC